MAGSWMDNPSTEATAPAEIVIVDSGVAEPETLLDGLPSEVPAYRLDPGRDGLEQIGEILARHRDLEAVHLVSHGAAGRLELADRILDAQVLREHGLSLGRWRQALSDQADLLLYGCDVAQGAGGLAFVRQLAELTGADVAASDDRTGRSGSTRDWELEVATGEILASVPFSLESRQAYRHTLLSVLDWSTVVWANGDFTNTYTLLPDNVDVTITVSTMASGTFVSGAALGPYEDGAPISPAQPLNLFGSQLDLGVIFNPAANQGLSPILIQVSFTEGGTGAGGPAKAVTGLTFEISDIDYSLAGGGEGFRLDQVVITSDAGDPTLAFKTMGSHTFSIAGNTATANCSAGGAIGEACNSTLDTTAAPSDSGTVVVDFGVLAVTSATITYNEVSGEANPAGRGIGLLASFQASVVAIPAITLVKTGTLDLGGNGVANPGDLINYTFEVTNSGDVTLTNVVVSDPMVSPIACPGGNPIPSMAPAAMVTCTGSYAITQADIDAGQKDNTATATGMDPTGAPVSDQDPHSEPIPQTPAITLVKTGALDLGGNGVANPGDLINYNFQVTNSGNVTLTSVSVTDPMVSPITCPGGNPIPSMAPAAMVTCTGSYAITQADIDAGQKDNTATASGQDPGGNPVSDQDPHSEPIPRTPAITLVKTGALDLGGNGVANPGDLINYNFQVTNSGNVTLTGVSVTDPMVAPITCPGGNPIPSMAPAAMVTCTGSYAITQADIDAGQKDNTATASGQDPGGNPVSDQDSHTEPITTGPAIQLIKDGVLDVGGDGVPTPGDLINYTFQVTNIGTVTLTNVSVTDPMVSPITCPGGNPIPSMAPAAMVTCTGSYAITQADIDAGQKVNTATASGQDPTGAPVSDQDTHTEPIITGAAISLVKDGILDLGDGVADPGDLINYTFKVTNIGTVTLTNVLVSDPIVSPITCPGGNPIPSMAPAAMVTCTGSYAITQADIDAGQRDNTATAGSDQTTTVNSSHAELIPRAEVVPIPTLSYPGLILLALVLTLLAWWQMHRRRVRP